MGPIIINGPLDNSFQVHMIGFKKQGGEYKLMPYKLPPQGFCDVINNDPFNLPQEVEVSNLTLPIPCPILEVILIYDELLMCNHFQVNYFLNGYKASIPPPIMMAVQSGEYKANLTVVDKEGKEGKAFEVFASIMKV